MKVLKYIGLGLLSIIILLLVVSLFLPSKVRVERSIAINTAASIPYKLINNLEEFNSWSPWFDIDTTAQYRLSDTLIGTNAWISWNSKNPKVGEGKLTISENKPYELIGTKLEFGDWDASFSKFIFLEENHITKLTWTMENDFGYNLVGRYFGLFMDGMVGNDYQKGLDKIKQLCEAQPIIETVAGFEVNLRNMPEETYLYITNKYTPVEEIGIKIGENLMRLDTYFKANNITSTLPPFTAWFSDKHFITAMSYVGEVTLLDKGIKTGTLNAGEAFVVSYYGAYNNTKIVYENIENFLTEKGKTLSSPPREVYVTDPMLETDTSKWLTEIIFPIN